MKIPPNGPRGRPPLKSLLWGTAALLSLAGCGDDNPRSIVSPPPPTPSPPPTPTPPPPTPTPTGEALPAELLLAGATGPSALVLSMNCASDIGSIDANGTITFSGIPQRGSVYDWDYGALHLTGAYSYSFDDYGHGGPSFGLSDRTVAGPPFDTHINSSFGNSRLDIPHRTSAIDLEHSTFGLRFAQNHLCFFAGGLSGDTALLPGTYRGVADGLAFIDDKIYRLYGSETLWGGLGIPIDSFIQLVGYESTGGELDLSAPIPLGQIGLDETSSLFGNGQSSPVSGFTGHFTWRLAVDGAGLFGQFTLERNNGDIIFGVIALDHE